MAGLRLPWPFYEGNSFFDKNLYKPTGMRYIMFTILTDKETVEYGTDKKTEKCKTL